MYYVGNPCESRKGTKCGICEGDCDTDDDCEGPLRRCAHKTSLREEVPGCHWVRIPKVGVRTTKGELTSFLNLCCTGSHSNMCPFARFKVRFLS
jgi:hypothetical protein